jgi:predicted nucleic acid-binding protein
MVRFIPLARLRDRHGCGPSRYENILVYLYDQDDLARQNRALQVVQDVQVSGDGRLSVQTLAEFASVAIPKLRPPLTPAEVLRQVDQLARSYRVLEVPPPIVRETVRGVRDHQLAYCDAQIWATARLNQVPTVLSEDFRPGTTLEGVRFVNPCVADFVLPGGYKSWKP